MTSTAVRELVRHDIKQQRDQWDAMLRTACEAICHSGAISAMTAAARFEDLADIQRHDFLRRAEAVADDYGLDVSTSRHDGHLEARFSRRS